MPIGHGKIIEHQTAMKFSVVEMPSKMTGHTPAAERLRCAENRIRWEIWSKSKIKSKSKSKNKCSRQSASVSHRRNYDAFALLLFPPPVQRLPFDGLAGPHRGA